jgi:hypothetical protein
VSADTPPDVEVSFDALLARRSGSDRVRMVSEMFETARALAIADIRRVRPDISDTDLRLQLFDRFYGDEWSNAERADLRARLAGRPRTAPGGLRDAL